MGGNLHKEGIGKYYREKLEKIYCSTRKNIPSEIAYPFKNLLFGLEFNLKLYPYSSSDRLRTLINCQKTHYQPNSFAHSLTNLLYWAYWAHPLFLSGFGLRFVTLQVLLIQLFRVFFLQKLQIFPTKRIKKIYQQSLIV